MGPASSSAIAKLTLPAWLTAALPTGCTLAFTISDPPPASGGGASGGGGGGGGGRFDWLALALLGALGWRRVIARSSATH